MKKLITGLLKKKPHESMRDFNFRAGNFASIVGLIVNILLFSTKLAVGILVSSMAIVADAVNNLSDSFSSCMVIVSFKISKKPADKEHPFGHARIEYLFSSIVALIIVIVGVQLFWQSILKIKNPVEPNYSIAAVVVLAFSIAAKLFLSVFYMTIAEKINSSILKATSADSRADVLSTSVILLSIPVYYFTKFSVDSYLSLLVSVLIIKSGFEILKETIDHILGTAPAGEEIEKIKDFILSYDGIEGVHDMIVHDYGAAHRFVSAHAEVDAHTPILDSHAVIDKIESDAITRLGIQLLLHMDPIVKDDPELNVVLAKVHTAMKEAGFNFGIHDFRLVYSYRATNVIFDVDVPNDCKLNDRELSDKITAAIRKCEPTYNPVITLDRSYIRSSSIGIMK